MRSQCIVITVDARRRDGAGEPGWEVCTHSGRRPTGLDAVGIPVIASGGVGNLDPLADEVVEGRADAVLAASIFHFGGYTVPEAKARLAARGIEVRLGPPRPPPPGYPTASRPGTAPAPGPGPK